MSPRAWRALRERRDMEARKESARRISHEAELARVILREFPNMTRDAALLEAARIMAKESKW